MGSTSLGTNFRNYYAPVFGFSDKLRLLGEPFRKKGNNPNESLAELVLRRMGKSFLDYAIDPFILGIYSGNPASLVTQICISQSYTGLNRITAVLFAVP
jgi:protoporphyrinogen/coproporphyrinogen III oxidase